MSYCKLGVWVGGWIDGYMDKREMGGWELTPSLT